MELSVVLVVNQNDPSIFNPDFLRHNNIVDANLSVREQAISTPVFSQVSFQDGLVVKADPERVIFEQAGNPLDPRTVHCPASAAQFVQQFPHFLYKAVGINPKGIRVLAGDAVQNIMLSNALHNNGEWLSFQDTEPEIQLKAVYHFEKRVISLDVAKIQRLNNDRDNDVGILFQANIHRDLGEIEQRMRSEQILTIISSWKDDLTDFSTLVEKFQFGSVES